MMNDRPEDARNYFKKVVELTDTDPMADTSDRRETAFFDLGKLEMSEKNYDAAIGYFKQALRIRDDASDTYFFLAESLDAIGQTQDAMTNINVALKFDPNFAQAHYLLGKLWLAEGDKIKASAEIGKAIKLAPTAPEPQAVAKQIGDPAQLAQQAQTLATSDPEAALEAATIAYNLDPVHNVAAGRLKARLLLAQGKKSAALAVYKSLIQIQSASKDPQILAAIKKLTPKTAKSSTAATSSN
jgi:tetratricopeptide (TPR) repeat protein